MRRNVYDDDTNFEVCEFSANYDDTIKTKIWQKKRFSNGGNL